MNTKKMFALGAAAAAMMMGSSAWAGEGDTKTASGVTIGAAIITPLQIANTGSQGIQFGSIIPTTAGGTVLLTAAETPTVTATGVSKSQNTTTHTAAKFTVTGQASYKYSITLPASSTLSAGAGKTMTVDTFTATGGVSAHTLDATNSNDVFYVGATLNVGANQAPGDYSGTFSVSVAYD